MSIWYPGYGTSFSKYLLLETNVGRDLAGIIQKGSDNVASKVSEQTRSIVANNYQLEQTLGDGFNSITNEINWGYDRIEYALQDVNSSIESLHSDFNYGMALILEQAHVSNKQLSDLINKLDAVHKTLENPTLTLSRQFYRIGCERLYRGLLDKALESFKEAEKNNDTDVFTQFQIGKLFLYGINEDANVIDLDKAKLHLLYAARYAKSEKIVDRSFSKIEAEAYLHASIALYAQLGETSIKEKPIKFKELLTEATQLITKAISINPKFSEAYYHSAKYFALLKESSSSIENLEKAILIDRNYAIKVDVDHSFDEIRSEIVSFLNASKEKRKAECFSRAQFAETLFSAAMQWHLEDSLSHDEFNECREDIINARRIIQSDTIFGYLDALILYYKLICTLPGLIKRRIDSLKREVKENIFYTNKIIDSLGNSNVFFTYIDETKVHLDKANLCFYKNVSYLELVNALQESNHAYDVAKQADRLSTIIKIKQKNAIDRAYEAKRNEENEKRENERLIEIRNDASRRNAGQWATIFGMCGFLSGCVSCLHSGGSGQGYNWNFLSSTIIFAIIGAIIGGIAGQFKSK